MKLVREHINEIFTEDSDPIIDMSIGLKAVKNEMWKTPFGELNDKYFSKYRVKYTLDNWTIINCRLILCDSLCDIFGYMTDEEYHLTPQEAFNKTLNDPKFNRLEYNRGIIGTAIDDSDKLRDANEIRSQIIAEVLYDNWKIKIDPEIKNEALTEKFTVDSDPIKDLGIGVFAKRNFTVREDFINFLIDAMPTILGMSGIPEDIVIEIGYLNKKYFHIIREYLFKYDITFDSKSICDNDSSPVYFWPKFVRNELINRKIVKARRKIKESLNEKFTEDSDPIHDLGIGGINLSKEIYLLIEKFKLTNIHQMAYMPEVIKYWKDVLERVFLDRQVTGIFARGNENSWGAFHKLTTQEIKKVVLFAEDTLTSDNMAVLDFALIADDPGAWEKNLEDSKHYLENPDETWYYYSFGDMFYRKDYTPKQKYTIYLK
jgi:hypothetical protein